MIYFGCTTAMLQYFAGIFEYNKRQNPAEFIISAASGELPNKDGVILSISELAEAYTTSSDAASHRESLHRPEIAVANEEVMKESAYRTDTWTQIYTICHREYVKMIRMKSGHISNFVRYAQYALYPTNVS